MGESSNDGDQSLETTPTVESQVIESQTSDTSTAETSTVETPADIEIHSTPETHTPVFAKYVKISSNLATLKLESLGINLNLNFVDVAT